MTEHANMIPGIYAAGQFEANTPFDKVLDEKGYYSVEAVRTIAEMQGRKIDLYTLVLAPAGIPKDQTVTFIDELIKNKAVIVTLTRNGSEPIYIPSTYLKSFPQIDGVVYEHLCLVLDLGAVPPDFKDKIGQHLVELREYVSKNIGVDNTVQVGTIPQKAYVSKEQAKQWEVSRQLKIKDVNSTTVQLETANKEISELKAYITKLEAALKTK